MAALLKCNFPKRIVLSFLALNQVEKFDNYVMGILLKKGENVLKEGGGKEGPGGTAINSLYYDLPWDKVNSNPSDYSTNVDKSPFFDGLDLVTLTFGSKFNRQLFKGDSRSVDQKTKAHRHQLETKSKRAWAKGEQYDYLTDEQIDAKVNDFKLREDYWDSVLQLKPNLFPESLETLTFGDQFNQPINEVTFPPNLKKLTFGYNFNQEIDGATFPEGLTELNFGGNFNQPIQVGAFPPSLKRLTFGHEFNQKLESALLMGLEHLQVSEQFDQPFGDQSQVSQFHLESEFHVETAYKWVPGQNPNKDERLEHYKGTLSARIAAGIAKCQTGIRQALNSLMPARQINCEIRELKIPDSLQTLTIHNKTWKRDGI